MLRRDHRRVRIMRLLTLGALGAALFAAVGSPSAADVTSVSGGATDYLADVSLFGGPSVQRGPVGTPGCDPNLPLPGPGGTTSEACNISVTLPSTGGNPTASDPDGALARYAPAIVFSRGAATVSTEGTTGAGGSVTSSADIENINASGQEVFTASRLQSTCTATEDGVTGSTTVTGGTLITSEGDPNVDGDETVVTLPTNPEPNSSTPGVIEGVGDSFTLTLNEQTTNPDGSLTVVGAHLELLGPTAIGDLFIGRVDCGVMATQTTTTQPGGVTTTQPGGVTTTQPGGVTTTQPGGATTTTQPGGATTTTRPGGTTTTTRPAGTTTTTRVAGATTTAPPSSGSTLPPGQHGKNLVRTGSMFQSLAVLALLSLVVGALVLLGLSRQMASAGAGIWSGPWADKVRRSAGRHPRRRSWNRRPWS